MFKPFETATTLSGAIIISGPLGNVDLRVKRAQLATEQQLRGQERAQPRVAQSTEPLNLTRNYSVAVTPLGKISIFVLVVC